MWRKFLLLVVILFTVTSALAAPDLHSLASSVDAHYNHLQTLQAEFTEIYRGGAVARIESGTLWLKKPGKMRWGYRSPKEKLFVGDGKYAWFYVPGEKQVRRTPMRQLDDLRSPLAFLLGKTKLEKELRGLSYALDVTPLQANDLVLRGVPKALADRVNQVLIEITPGREIARLVIEEADGSTTDYRFSDQKENIKLEDSRFHFEVPPGAEVIDENFGQ